MKKSVLALALAFGVTTAFAQDLTSKKGEPILPEAGDWGLGIDAAPFLNYAGNMFGKTANNTAPTWNFLTNNQTISGRYFADEKTVYRGAVRLGFGSSKASNMVNDDANTSSTPAYKEDTKKTSMSGIGLSGGIEMRKGKTRLQGYYGGEVGIYFGGKSDTYTYGNAFSASGGSPWAPTSTSWSGLTPTGSSTMSSRTTAQKFGSTFTFGLRGFIGAEYFVLPKMSIGGEFGWGLGFTSVGQGSTTTEAVNSTFNGTTNTTVNTGKGSSFGLDTDNMNTVFGSSAQLRFNMYF